jgi:hypothetical protein
MICTQPSISLLVKLGSIAVHTDEYLSTGGHPFDRTAIEQLLIDPEVKQWIIEMGKMGMLPIKRGR